MESINQLLLLDYGAILHDTINSIHDDQIRVDISLEQILEELELQQLNPIGWQAEESGFLLEVHASSSAIFHQVGHIVKV